jgi:hypothetical protein
VGRAALARLALVVCGALSPGCYSPVGELVATHIEPGGTLSAGLDGGPQTGIKGLADATSDPMTVNGSSALLVIGIVIGDDDATATAAKPMLLKDQAVTMSISTVTRTQLGVHLNGRSCTVVTGGVALRPDGKGHLDGEFSGTGADGCRVDGKLAGVPIEE